MRSSLVSAKLDSSIDVSQKASAKASSSADSPDRSFQHVLTNARKPAATTHQAANLDKPKSGKTSKAKQTKATDATAAQSKKGGKTDSEDSDDTDSKDASADSTQQDDSSSDPNEQASATAQKNIAKQTESDHEKGDPEDAASISDDAQSAAQRDSASDTEADATAHAAADGKAPAKPKATTDSPNPNATAGNAPASTLTANAVKAINANHQKQGKGDNSSSAGNGQVSTGDQKSAETSASDLLTTTPTLASTAQSVGQKGSRADASSGAVSQVDPSSDGDDDASDAAIQVASAQITPATQADVVSDGKSAGAAPTIAAVTSSSFATVAQAFSNDTSPTPTTTSSSSTAATKASTNNPGAKFVAENHPNIVQSVKTQLLPTGGTMKLRLDPPELGAMQVTVHVKAGVVTASFETSNDQATKMLSHSLGQLKQALESQGITVGKIHVQQAPKNQTASDSSTDSDRDSSDPQENTSSSQQDEQRREALRRMWEKLSIGGDPLDMVA